MSTTVRLSTDVLDHLGPAVCRWIVGRVAYELQDIDPVVMTEAERNIVSLLTETRIFIEKEN